nr:MAG TPA: Photosynthetic reaction centre, H-chain N-terminal region [Caudoviricetes sp.]
MIYLYSIIEGLFFTDFFSHSRIEKQTTSWYNIYVCTIYNYYNLGQHIFLFDLSQIVCYTVWLFFL